MYIYDISNNISNIISYYNIKDWMLLTTLFQDCFKNTWHSFSISRNWIFRREIQKKKQQN